jgi:hypothetical protein
MLDRYTTGPREEKLYLKKHRDVNRNNSGTLCRQICSYRYCLTHLHVL